MRFTRLTLFAALATVAGCTTQPAPRPVAVALSYPAPAAPVSFAGYGRLAVPARLADGRYATPNSNVSVAAAIWHVRAGLNVAALSCRGPEEAVLVAGYNALLQRHRAAFDQAYRTLAQEHGNAAAFDGAMTTLYNYYALPAAQAGLCAAAQQVLADAAAISPDALAGFAPAALASLERPYIIVFARQEAWLTSLRPRTGDSATIATAVAVNFTSPRPTAEPAVLRR